ncbi:MAG: YtxH domain-containing protein [Candidatus Gastranaerophilales bacterium]|nr:YtxH domain-containing protein [Candidatus Gastranaerophilales bacterium]
MLLMERDVKMHNDEKFTEKMKDGFEKTGEMMKEGFEKAKDFVHDTTENVKEKIKDGAEKLNDMKDNVADKIQNTGERLSEQVCEGLEDRIGEDGADACFCKRDPDMINEEDIIIREEYEEIMPEDDKNVA